MGSYLEHITANDEAAKDRLMKGLDGCVATFNNQQEIDWLGRPSSGN